VDIWMGVWMGAYAEGVIPCSKNNFSNKTLRHSGFPGDHSTQY
jgi:hypothetical protein